jgi:hypothetical protein
MKKIITSILALSFLAANAQTADEVVQKYSAAMGGLDAFDKITTVKITGNYFTQGNELPMTIQMINNKGVRTDIEAMGQFVTNVYFNGTGWKINPFAGVTTATAMTGNELADFKAQASLATNLMDYKKRGHAVELLGEEDVEGIKCYKLKFTNADTRKETFYFINTADNIILKSVTKADIQGQETVVEAWYSDIKDFNGLKFAMTRSSRIDGQVFQEVKFDKIELNVPVDESIFKM